MIWIDPLPAISAYMKALSGPGRKLYGIKVVKDCDHNMCINETGCLNEISERNKSGNYHYFPEYFKTIKEWIELLFN